MRSQKAKKVLPAALFLAHFTRKLWQSSFQLLIRTLPTFSAAQCIQPNLTKRYNTQYPICSITATYVTNSYSQEISLFISRGEETTSAEGTTQGGPNSISI